MSARHDRAAIALFCLAAAFAPLQARAADLILAVAVNGLPQPGFGDFVERGGQLFATPAALAQVGIALPESAAPDAEGLVALDAVPGLSYAFDFAEQAVAFTVDFDLHAGTEVSAQHAPRRTDLSEAATALVLNYDASVSATSSGDIRWGSFLGGRLSTPWGVAETTGFVRGDGTGAGVDAVRLDSWYETHLPDSMITFRVGDAVTASTGWTRPIRFGGLVARRDFAIRPDLVTVPVPAFDGTAEVPSAVDVLIDGVKRASYDVAPGPFRITDLPIVSGAGQVTLVVRDALGRERVETISYFAPPSLLAAGLFDWSIEAGALRERYGRDSFGYGPWIAAGTARWGATPWLTLEAHAEGAEGLGSGGGAAIVGLGTFGAVSAFAAGSVHEDRGGEDEDGDLVAGFRVGGTYDWSNGWLNLGAQAEFADPGFTDLAGLSGSDHPTLSWRMGAGLNLDPFGTLGVTYIERRYEGAEDHRMVTASYSLPLPGRIQLGITGVALPDRDEWQVSASLSMPLGPDLRTSTRTRADAQGWAETTADLAATARGLDDVSWRVSASQGRKVQRLSGMASWQTAYGSLSGRGEATDDRWAVEMGGQGALVAAPAGFAASRRIDGPFAIVDVGGLRGVTVRDGNRAVGQTGWLGPAIVPDLRPWEATTIRIDSLDVPFEIPIASDHHIVIPPGRVAVAVDFGGQQMGTNIVVALVDEAGRPIPAGVAVSADGRPSAFPVGNDGEAYFENVADRFTVEATGLWGRCEARIEVPPNPPPRLGPVTCTKTL